MKILVIGTTTPEVQPGGISSFLREAKKLPRYEGAVFLEWTEEESETQLSLGRFDKSRLLRTLCAQFRVLRYAYHFKSIEVHSIRTGLAALLIFPRRCIFFYHGPGFQEAAVEGAGRLKVFMLYLIETLLIGGLKGYLTASQAFRLRLRENYGVSLDKITVIRPKVNFDRDAYHKALERKTYATEEGGVLKCVICRRFVHRVGILEFLGEFRKAAAITNVQIDIVGHGPLKTEIENAVKNDDRVRYIGPVTDEERNQIYAYSAINIVPTVHLEGLGMVIYEGAQFGAMPLVTNCGGMPELIDELGVGRYFSSTRELIENLKIQTLRNEIEKLSLGFGAGEAERQVIQQVHTHK